MNTINKIGMPDAGGHQASVETYIQTHNEAGAIQLPVNELFCTMQGEATHTGTPATFLRLQGCAVSCPWCDTSKTWHVNPSDEVPVTEMLSKVNDSSTYASMPTAEIIEVLAARAPRAVVITGGEPCNYDLRALTTGLLRVKTLVQIETSGTQPIQADPDVWVTVSPKVGMPGGFRVRHDAVDLADEIKWPVGSPRDVANLIAFLDTYKVRPMVPVWLQPLSRSKKATDLCIEQATLNGWRVSIQVHALLGVR